VRRLLACLATLLRLRFGFGEEERTLAARRLVEERVEPFGFFALDGLLLFERLALDAASIRFVAAICAGLRFFLALVFFIHGGTLIRRTPEREPYRGRGESAQAGERSAAS
jgi:hypothetical protein